MGQPVKESSEVKGRRGGEEEGKGTRVESDRVNRIPGLPLPNCWTGASP